MSAESGVPTYRGKGGIWGSYDYEDCACQVAFDRDPAHVWAFHNFRRGLVGACEPNLGHQLVAKAAEVLPSVRVVTQNIDGLHQLAGNTDVVELHGSLWRVRCDACGAGHEDREAPKAELRCTCGAWLRPDIVWFGDGLFQHVVEEAEQVISTCDLLVSVGTAAVVYPAAQLPMLAQRAGARLVEVNPESTPMSGAYDECLRGSATEMLERLCQGL
jgi:NAD-dependent deacetylase